MKRMLTFLLLAAVFTSCTITVTPIKPTKKKRIYQKTRHYASSRTTVKKPVVIANTAPNIKETWWIENYKKLQEAHGGYTISDDANIQPLPDGRFKVPDAVLNHYQDLLLAKPSPKP